MNNFHNKLIQSYIDDVNHYLGECEVQKIKDLIMTKQFVRWLEYQKFANFKNFISDYYKDIFIQLSY